MCELLHTLNASFLECGEHAVCTEWRAVAFSAVATAAEDRLIVIYNRWHASPLSCRWLRAGIGLA